ncbi:MAG TPA: preprotein translocase subunit SecE [Candidatus Limnocylindria bacterium]|nr:preprotein translocase subunit SecE [Candidatus Limnocylindria bacterium]
MVEKGVIRGVGQFLQEVRGELGKVVWPKFPSLVESTVVVLMLVVVFSIYLGIVDVGLVKCVEYVIKNYG